jgi:hypothetical protein
LIIKIVYFYWYESRGGGLLVGKPEGKSHYEDHDVGGWIILAWILERWDGAVWTGLVWFRIGTGGELL